MTRKPICPKCGELLRHRRTEWVLDARRHNQTAGLHEFECSCGESVILFVDTDKQEKIAYHNQQCVLADYGARFYQL